MRPSKRRSVRCALAVFMLAGLSPHLAAQCYYTVTEIPAGLLPERPKPTPEAPKDPALAEYNAYLAELAETDKKTRQDQ